MKVIYGLDSPDARLPRSSVTIGNFDGVHRGHQRIIAQARRVGEGVDAPTVVLTFEPHPLTVVAPARAPARLTPLPEKLDRLADAGAQIAVVARANRDLLALTPRQFIERVVGRLHPSHIVEGPSFGFGRGRSGTSDTLRQLGAEQGFEVLVADPVRVALDRDATVEVSSSLVRRLIAEGRVERATLCLGRPYALIGKVVVGIGRGKGLGFPTINLAVEDQLIPADGVYAGRARLELDPSAGPASRVAAISIGTTPTFEDAGPGQGPAARRVEAYLLDTEAELYGREVRLEFGTWLRTQEKFESAAALSAQIARDVQAVRRYAVGQESSVEC